MRAHQRVSWPDPTGAGSVGYRAMSLSDAATLGRAMSAARGSVEIERLAAALGVSRRTAYRWRGAELHEVTVGGHVATFVTRPHQRGGRPVQVTPWREALP